MASVRDLFDTISWDNIVATNTTANAIRFSDLSTTTTPVGTWRWNNVEPSFTYTVQDDTFDPAWRSFIMSKEWAEENKKEEPLQAGDDDKIDEFLDSFVLRGDDNE